MSLVFRSQCQTCLTAFKRELLAHLEDTDDCVPYSSRDVHDILSDVLIAVSPVVDERLQAFGVLDWVYFLQNGEELRTRVQLRQEEAVSFSVEVVLIVIPDEDESQALDAVRQATPRKALVTSDTSQWQPLSPLLLPLGNETNARLQMACLPGVLLVLSDHHLVTVDPITLRAQTTISLCTIACDVTSVDLQELGVALNIATKDSFLFITMTRYLLVAQIQRLSSEEEPLILGLSLLQWPAPLSAQARLSTSLDAQTDHYAYICTAGSTGLPAPGAWPSVAATPEQPAMSFHVLLKMPSSVNGDDDPEVLGRRGSALIQKAPTGSNFNVYTSPWMLELTEHKIYDRVYHEGMPISTSMFAPSSAVLHVEVPLRAGFLVDDTFEQQGQLLRLNRHRSACGWRVGDQLLHEVRETSFERTLLKSSTGEDVYMQTDTHVVSESELPELLGLHANFYTIPQEDAFTVELLPLAYPLVLTDSTRLDVVVRAPAALDGLRLSATCADFFGQKVRLRIPRSHLGRPMRADVAEAVSIRTLAPRLLLVEGETHVLPGKVLETQRLRGTSGDQLAMKPRLGPPLARLDAEDIVAFYQGRSVLRTGDPVFGLAAQTIMWAVTRRHLLIVAYDHQALAVFNGTRRVDLLVLPRHAVAEESIALCAEESSAICWNKEGTALLLLRNEGLTWITLPKGRIAATRQDAVWLWETSDKTVLRPFVLWSDSRNRSDTWPMYLSEHITFMNTRLPVLLQSETASGEAVPLPCVELTESHALLFQSSLNCQAHLIVLGGHVSNFQITWSAETDIIIFAVHPHQDVFLHEAMLSEHVTWPKRSVWPVMILRESESGQAPRTLTTSTGDMYTLTFVQSQEQPSRTFSNA